MNKEQYEEQKRIIKEYLRTFFITLGVMILIVALIMGYTWFNIPNTIKKQKNASSIEELDYYLIDFLIAKNQYLLAKYPKNYGYNLRLGTLYAVKRDYNNSEREFKVAVEKSPYMAYKARYRLATLYVKMDKLAEAQKLMDDITDKPDKKLIKNKGIIYQDIGNKLYEKKYYPQAISKYEKAIFYFKRSDKKLLKEAQIDLSNCYEAMADIFVEKGLIEEGTYYLEKADLLNDKPEINYKLALLYIETNPDKAYDLLEYVRKKAPELIDYYMYYDLLLKISESAGELGDTASRDLYKIKAQKFKEYVSDTILHKNDVIVHFSNIETSYDKQNKILTVHSKIQLRNNSPFNIKNLTARFIFKEDNNRVKTYEKTLFAYENIFPIGQTTSVINLSIAINGKNLNPDVDTIDSFFYIYKKDRKHKMLIKEFQIKKPSELVKYRNKD